MARTRPENGSCNATAITINDEAVATPYPSTINVSGLVGVISNVTVSVTGFSHTFPEDVSVLLVGPTGQKMVLWAESGGGDDSTNANLTFSDAATSSLPSSGGLTTGNFKPTNLIATNVFGSTDFPAPAPTSTPASPYAATLSSFNNTNPNGTWSLYVIDIAGGDTGMISGGWCLNITTAPSVTTCGPTLLQGSIGTGDLTQVSRIFRDGEASQCGSPKVCPGSSGSSTLRYDTYTLTNQSASPACVTVTTTSSCGVNVFASAYMTSYTPPPPSSNLCVNYLADAGNSPQSNGVGGAFSFTVPAGATFVLVANEITASTPCAAYSLLVEGNICAPGGKGDCTLTCPANITKSNDPNQCGAVVTYPAPTTEGMCGSVSCSPASGSFFQVGTTTVTCSASGDACQGPNVVCGLGSTCTFTVKVNDTQPPVIMCPGAVTAVAPQNTCNPGACVVANFPPPTASDNCPGVTKACNPPSGSCFPLGTTTVTCTATDASGNTSPCSFTVTAFDVCIQDNSTVANQLLFNSVSGAYRFCCAGVTYTGVGKISKQGCIITLEHNSIDRRVRGTTDKSVFRGNASAQSPPGRLRCTISDSDIRNNTCSCGAGPPPPM